MIRVSFLGRRGSVGQKVFIPGHICRQRSFPMQLCQWVISTPSVNGRNFWTTDDWDFDVLRNLGSSLLLSYSLFYNWKSYRVACYSCHPLISYVPEWRKNLNWPPSEMTVQNLPPQNLAESITLVSLGVASSGLCHFFKIGKFWTLSFEGVASSGTCCFFSILAHKEIREWQKKRSTLTVTLYLKPFWRGRAVKLWEEKCYQELN